MEQLKLNTIDEALDDFREGKFVIVVDDEDRENEGDLICAAEKITPEMVNFMLKNARGVLCAPVTISRAAELELPHQVQDNTSLLGTPFTVTVDKIEGCSTGVSAHDRAATIRALADPESTAKTFGRPGHISPLYAQDNGVLRRSGHTEAAIDLCKLSGLYPAGALIEIMNDDGTMARMPQLLEFSRQHQLKIITIKDLIAYRLQKESLVERGEEVDMPTFNFLEGKREYRGKKLKMGSDDILVIEGIHGLNPRMTYRLPDERKFRVYISALTQLKIDEHNCISTRDGRLIRRIIRDDRTRGNGGRTTSIPRCRRHRRKNVQLRGPYTCIPLFGERIHFRHTRSS